MKQGPAVDQLLARALASLCLALAVLAGTASLTGVVEGTSWIPGLLVPVIAVHLASGLIRGVRVIRWLAVPTAGLIIWTAVIRHEAMTSNTYGVTTTQWFLSALSESGIQLAAQVPPVANSFYVDFAILILALAVSFTVELLASFRRTSVLVIIPLSFAPIIASLFKQEGAGIGYLALLVTGLLGYIALSPYTFRSARARPTQRKFLEPRALGVFGLTVAACVASLLAASLWVPGFRTGMFPEGQRPSGDVLANNVDPLINLGRDLRSNSSKSFLTYYTSSEQAPYLRTQVIKDLTEQRWEPDEDLFYSDYYGDTAVSSDFSMFSSTEEVLRMTWPNGNANPLLPLPNQSYFVQGIKGDWRWTHETAVAKLSGDALSTTNEITVSYAQLNITASMIESINQQYSTNDSPSPMEYSELPADPDNTLTPVLKQTLQEAYRSGKTPLTDLEKAVALQEFFRSGNFVYSERTPLREGYDGANAHVVKAFLDRRQGYCVHFASAMALLAREEGIPSRIAVGYAPGVATGKSMKLDEIQGSRQFSGRFDSSTQLTGYKVSGQQAHAWPELYLDGLGWVPFEPTPGRGYTPSYAPEPTRSPVPQESTAPEVPTERSAPNASPFPTPSAQPNSSQSSGDGGTALWLVPLLVVIAAGLCIGPWRRNRIHQSRLRRIRNGSADSAQALWAEVLSVGADSGIPAGPHESVGDYTVRLSDDYPNLTKDLSLLQHAIEQSFYADRHLAEVDSAELLDALHSLQQSLHRELPTGRKILSFLFPPSLRSVVDNKSQITNNSTK